MNYIYKLIGYINSNIGTMEIHEHDVYKQGYFSRTKTNSDFKAFTDTTIRRYINNK